MGESLITSKLATVCEGRLGLRNGGKEGFFLGTVRDYRIPDNLDPVEVMFEGEPAKIRLAMSPCPFPLSTDTVDAGLSGVHLFGRGVLVRFPRQNGYQPVKFTLLSAEQFARDEQGEFVSSATLRVDRDKLVLEIGD